MARSTTSWQKGAPSPNPGGRALPTRIAARSLALVCKEAVSDEELVDILLTIASGRWPEIRPAPKNPKGETPTMIDMTSPPDGTHRMAALKEFILRRDGQPMQSIALIADIEARARRIENASDAIELEAIDAVAAGVLEVALIKALGAANIEDAIDVDPAEAPT